MKNNILIKFAINDLKNHKRDAIITVFTVFVASIIAMMISLLTPLFTDETYLKYIEENGHYSYSVDYYTLDNKDKLEDAVFQINNQEYRLDDLKHCWIYSYGETLCRETIDVLDGDNSILSVHLSKGTMPLNDVEIAVKPSVLKEWGYPVKLNEFAEFSFVSYKDANIVYKYQDSSFSYDVLNSSIDTKEFKVVGLLKEEGNSDIIVGGKSTELFNLYIYSGFDETTDDYLLIDNYEDYHLIPSYRRDDFNDVMSTNIILILIQVVISITCLSLIYGLTLSAFEKKQKDFTLLRSVGATQRQIYFIILLQSLILSIIPIILSIIIVYIVSQVLSSMFLTLVPRFELINMVSDGLIILFVVFLSYFIPARSVTRKAMSGTFDGMEFQRIYYQYKKLHELKPFYLAWRQLVSVKKKLIIKVFLVALVSISAMSIVKDLIVNYHSLFENSSQYKYQINVIDFDYDIDSIKKYVDKIISVDYFIGDAEYLIEYANDISFGVQPYVYCQNNDFNKYHQIQSLQDDEIIVSDYYLSTLNKNYSVGESIIFSGEKYKLAHIIRFDQQMVVLNQNNYEKYKKENKHSNQFITLEFKDANQKTKALLECNELMKIINRDGGLYKNYNADKNIGFMDILNIISIDLLSIVSFSIIYIFQYSFELNKQKEDIGSYQLLGFTRKEISSIYFYKSFIIGIIGLICGGIYFYLDIYYIYNELINYQYVLSIFNIGLMILGAVFVIVVISIISLYPLLFILKNEGIENKYTRE